MRLGVDVGTVRVGLAASDPEGLMAFPVATIQRGPRAALEVSLAAAERDAVEVYVGLPKKLSGEEGTSAADARAFAAELAELVTIPVRLVDERFSTSQASRAMREAGKNSKSQRGSIDSAAAAIILESALEIARSGNLGTVTWEVVREENHD